MENVVNTKTNTNINTNNKKEKVPRKNQEFRNLCEWLEINIFNYDISVQRLQTDACLVLMGLKNGKAVANNKTENNGNYSWDIILMTFKINKKYILSCIQDKTFQSERTKMTYICKIVQDKINDVYQRSLNMKKSQNKIENIDTSIATYECAEYKPETHKKINKRLEDLW